MCHGTKIQVAMHLGPASMLPTECISAGESRRNDGVVVADDDDGDKDDLLFPRILILCAGVLPVDFVAWTRPFHSSTSTHHKIRWSRIVR